MRRAPRAARLSLAHARHRPIRFAERCEHRAYLLYSMAMSGVIYPAVVHWAWSRHAWLAVGRDDDEDSALWALTYFDFAGSGVVHMVGGLAGAIGAWMLGARQGRFGADGAQNEYDAPSAREPNTHTPASPRRAVAASRRRARAPRPAGLLRDARRGRRGVADGDGAKPLFPEREAGRPMARPRVVSRALVARARWSGWFGFARSCLSLNVAPSSRAILLLRRRTPPDATTTRHVARSRAALLMIGR